VWCIMQHGNKNSELEAFDTLPQELRTELNYASDRLDPRFILGILKNQGLEAAKAYINDITKD
jgi:hypothetical protein